MPLPGLTVATVFCGPRPAAWKARSCGGTGRLDLVAVPVDPGGPVPPEVDAVLEAPAWRELGPGGRERVLSVVGECRLLLRARFTPGLRVDDERVRAVLSIVEQTGGLVFDSRVVRDERGVGLLDLSTRLRPAGAPQPR